MSAPASVSESRREPPPEAAAALLGELEPKPRQPGLPAAAARCLPAQSAPAKRFASLALACAAALGIGWLGHAIELGWQPGIVRALDISVSEKTRPETSRADLKVVPQTSLVTLAGSPETSLVTPAPPSGQPPVDVKPSANPPEPTVSGPISVQGTTQGIYNAPFVSLFQASESVVLEALRSQPISRIKMGSGGRSLAFKLTLADGTRGYYKPEQTVSSANWKAEVAAFYLDRALGLGRVPPVVSRAIPWSQLSPAAESDRRVSEVVVQKNGKVRGAFIYWLPQKLVPATTPGGWENWVRVEPFARWSISPYQSSAAFGAALRTARAEVVAGRQAHSHYDEVPTPLRAELPAELSDVIVFDYLTLNYDRWGGDNTNVLTLGKDGPLIFLDNGDAFSAGRARRALLDARLKPLQRFRKRTIDALKALDVTRLGETLAHDAQGPLLDARGIAGLALRRKIVLEHVAAQARRFGDAVYAW